MNLRAGWPPAGRTAPRRPVSEAIAEAPLARGWRRLRTHMSSQYDVEVFAAIGESNVIGPDSIDKLREPAKRLAAWRRLITDTVESVTVAPAMTADGRPSHLWDPRRIH